MKRLVVLCFVLLTGSFSCKKEEDLTTAVPQTVSDLLTETPTFSLLRAAIQQAGMGDALKATNLTVFAPNDDAFKNKGFTSPESFKNISVETLRDILRYHVITGVVTTKTPEVVSADNLAVETANPAALFLTNTADGLFVNGVKVTKSDQPVANGVVHTIGTMLYPAAADGVQALKSRPDMTLLAAAVSRAAIAQPELLAIFNGTTATASLKQVTVFAPNDLAFSAAGYRTVAEVNAAVPATLANLLRYHVVPGMLFSNRLQAGQLSTLNTTTANKLTIAVSASGAVTVKGNRNATPATVRDANVTSKNAVIHVIDQVLLPA